MVLLPACYYVGGEDGCGWTGPLVFLSVFMLLGLNLGDFHARQVLAGPIWTSLKEKA
jgi:hypothetical protein